MSNDYDRARQALANAGLDPDKFVDGPTGREAAMQGAQRSLRGDGVPPGVEPPPPPLGAHDYHEMGQDGIPDGDRAAAIFGSWIGGAVEAQTSGALRPGGTFDPMAASRHSYASSRRARRRREERDEGMRAAVQQWAAEGRR